MNELQTTTNAFLRRTQLSLRRAATLVGVSAPTLKSWSDGTVTAATRVDSIAAVRRMTDVLEMDDTTGFLEDLRSMPQRRRYELLEGVIAGAIR